MHPVRALALPALVLLAATACSLLAPSDDELMGGAAQATSPEGGGEGLEGNEAGAGSSASLGGTGPEEPSTLPQAGGGAVGSHPGGASAGGELTSLIPQRELALWLMADQGTALGSSDGVALWTDHSPNAAHAKQSLEGLQPKLAAAAGAVPEMLEFDGVDDQLALPPGFNDFSAGLSVFIIASATTDLACPSLLHLSNAPNQQDIEVGRYQGSIHYEVEGDQVWGTANAFGLNQRVLLGVVHARNEAPELRLNGVFMASGEFTELPAVELRANNFIGRSLYPGCELFQGKIGEIIVYARALESAEREAVQHYLQGRWSYEPPVRTKPGPGEIPAEETL